MLVPYPKFVFMYPTLIVTVFAAIILTVGGYHSVDPATQTLPVVMTGLFLVVMMANMFVIVFDFPRATSLTLVFIVTIRAARAVDVSAWQARLPAIDRASGIRGTACRQCHVLFLHLGRDDADVCRDLH